jgi:hypothetical protein
MREYMEFSLIKEGIPVEELENADDHKVYRWFSILIETNRIREESISKR